MTLRSRLLVLTTLGLVATAFAVLGPGALNLKQVAGAPEPASTSRVLGAELTLQPTTAIPNQSIVLRGTGFTLSSVPGGLGPNGLHQITGTGSSFIKLGGVSLTFPSVTYPINADSAGNMVTTLSLPVSLATLAAGTLAVVVTDDAGATASATLTIPARTLTLDPSTSRRASTVTATGANFPADSPGVTGSYPVSLTYAGTTLGTVTPDSSGSFVTTFLVPLDAQIPSTNTVTASVLGQTATATATHTMSSPAITLVPTTGPPGTSIAVIGSNFPTFATVSSLTIGGVQALSVPTPSTDGIGAFSIYTVVPQLSSGGQVVIAGAGGTTAVEVFTVDLSGVAPTRTPTPTPTPSVPPAVALELLLTSDNLLRVWTFDNATKAWSFFDPRPAFDTANTITGMEAGQVYWINVVFDQAVTLNGKARVLNSGWNLMSW